jgi:hypothetical protein
VKKSANRDAYESLAEAIQKSKPDEAPLAREDWDFSACPEDQLRACLFYELARECPHAIRVARTAHNTLLEITAAYGTKHHYSLASSVIEIFKDCPEFPRTPFLCIPKEDRKRRIANCSQSHGLVQADLPALLRQHADKIPRRKTIGKTLKYLAGQGDIAAFYFDWRSSDEQLTQGFRELLRVNRPLTAIRISRKGKGSSPEQLRKDLKALGVYRLLQRTRWEDAYNETRDVLRDKNGKSRGLFSNHALAWRRARKQAEKMIAEHCRLMERLS